MSDDSITVKVLSELRADVREVQGDVRESRTELCNELRTTNQRIDRTNERLEQMRLEIKSELAGVETRIATRQTEHTAATRDLYDLIQDRLQLRDRVEQLESDVANLKNQVG